MRISRWYRDDLMDHLKCLFRDSDQWKFEIFDFYRYSMSSFIVGSRTYYEHCFVNA
jgi:hypothetical protein